MTLLKKLETALNPDIRKQYMVQSHRNLISIMKQEAKYFELIELINSGYEVNSSSESGNTTPFKSGKEIRPRTLLNQEKRPRTLLVIFLK
jgi:hypothetical protein